MERIVYSPEEIDDLFEGKGIGISDYRGKLGLYMAYIEAKLNPGIRDIVTVYDENVRTTEIKKSKGGLTVVVSVDGGAIYRIHLSSIVKDIKNNVAVIYEFPDGIYIRGNEAGIGKYKGKAFLTEIASRTNEIVVKICNAKKIIADPNIKELFVDVKTEEIEEILGKTDVSIEIRKLKREIKELKEKIREITNAK